MYSTICGSFAIPYMIEITTSLDVPIEMENRSNLNSLQQSGQGLKSSNQTCLLHILLIHILTLFSRPQGGFAAIYGCYILIHTVP